MSILFKCESRFCRKSFGFNRENQNSKTSRTPDLKDNGITFIKTDENGYFSITGYENHACLIGAFTDSRDGNESLEAINAVVNVLPKKEIKELKLVLDQDGNADCKKCGNYLEFPKTNPRNK
ncbi:MAG: hypothetical protein LH472_14150 [Pyrinomonadaceae bacterium]|nr:hypothetical protein [Pyrinomonadaceae bacterium]